MGSATVTVRATVTASGEVTTPDMTTAGIKVEHKREIRYSSRDEEGVRYVEIVDGDGNLIVSGMGEAADALGELMLYLLPSSHPDYPIE